MLYEHISPTRVDADPFMGPEYLTFFAVARFHLVGSESDAVKLLLKTVKPINTKERTILVRSFQLN